METNEFKIEGEINLVQRDTLLTALKRVDFIKSLVLSNDVDSLRSLGFDSDLLPIMRLFAQKEMAIIGTYSHPTELDLHKIRCSLLLTTLCANLNIPLSRVKVNQFDTRRIHFSTLRPLAMVVFGLTQPEERLLELGFKQNIENIDIAVNIFDKMLQNDITVVLQERNVSKSIGKEIKSEISALIRLRLTKMNDLCQENARFDEMSINIRMKEFNIGLAKLILGQNSDVIRNLGEKTLSEDLEYTTLIRESLRLLIEIKGIGLIKSLFAAGKEQSILRIYHEENVGEVVLNSVGQFELRIGRNLQIISDNDFVNLISVGFALSKLECLALAAGGQIIHIGTERGSGAKAVNALGITGPAAEFIVNNLTFGERNIHGHDGLIVGKKLVPLPLQYAMLGAENIRNLIKLPDPIVLGDGIKEMRMFFARSLIEQAVRRLEI